MKPLTIVIVEDNEMNLTLAQDLLDVRGHSVTGLSRPADALALPPGLKPDIVLMDIMLPEVDGITLMRQLRQKHGWNGMPFVAFTAHAMVGDRERLLAEGFVGYISKPIQTRQFAAEVEAFARAI